MESAVEPPQTPPLQSPSSPSRNFGLPTIPLETGRCHRTRADRADKPQAVGVSAIRGQTTQRGASGRETIVQTPTQGSDVSSLWREHPKPIRSHSDLGSIVSGRTRTLDLNELDSRSPRNSPSTPRDIGAPPHSGSVADPFDGSTTITTPRQIDGTTNPCSTPHQSTANLSTTCSTVESVDQTSTDRQMVSTENSLAVAVEMPQRTCVVCMDKRINTAALACRHSTLCDSCMIVVRASTGRCPVCRAHIDYVLHGDFADEFVDLAALTMAKVRRNVGHAGSSAFDELYENIRGLLAFSFLCMVSGAVMLGFMGVKVMAGIVAACLLFLISCVCGYLPWFVITVQAFESEEGIGGSGPRQAFLSRDDLSRPGMLCLKVLFIILFGPALLVLFVLPYFVLIGIVRPLMHHVLPVVAATLLQIFFAIVCTSFMFIFRPVGASISHACKWVGTNAYTVMKPCIDVLSPCCGQAKAIVVAICSYLKSTIQKLSTLMHSCGAKLMACLASLGLCWVAFYAWCGDLSNNVWNTLLAVSNGVTACCMAMYAGLEKCATEIQGSLWRCGVFICASLKNLVSPLAPCAVAIVGFATAACQAIDAACCEPLRRCCTAFATCLQAAIQKPLDCIGRSCTALYRDVLAPMYRAVSAALACLRRGLAAVLRVPRDCLHVVIATTKKLWNDVVQWMRQFTRDLRASFSSAGG